MKSIIKLSICFLLTISVVACSSNDDAAATMIADEIFQTLTAQPPTIAPPTNTTTPTLTSTATLSPTHTSTVTITPTPTLIPKIGEPIDCMSIYQIRFIQPPRYTKYSSSLYTASGIYMVLRVELTNLTDEPLSLYQDDVKVSGTLDDRELKYDFDWMASWMMSFNRAGLKTLADDVQPMLPWTSDMLFDVNQDLSNWQFYIHPTNRDDVFCTITIPFE